MEYVTRSITIEEKEKIISFYSEKQVENNGEYIVFAARENDTNIFIYESKKGFKVSFQGKNALYEANIFFPDATLKEKKEKVKTEFLDFSSQIGSDEVGTGDVFGPLVVTACYYDENTLKELDFKIAFIGGNKKSNQNIDKYKLPRYIIYKNTSIESFKKMVN